MAVPKKKSPRYKTNIRKSTYLAKTKAPTLSECPQCHQMKRPHFVCRFCGYYDGKEVLKTKSSKKKVIKADKE